MTENDFIPKQYSEEIKHGEVSWSAPSNIALIKYWGKLENQIPANPSLSFTLNNCKTITKLTFSKLEKPTSEFQVDVFFENEKNESFRPKILQFFKRIEKYLPFLRDYKFSIETANTFPHSSGIASSASGMAALSLCLMEVEKMLNPEMTLKHFHQKASFLARLGSGSACRSIKGEIVVWGKHEQIRESSDLYGTAYSSQVHENFKNFQDTILLIDKGEKQVSSSVGHNLMNNHPFAQQRFAQAHENLRKLKVVLENGDLKSFINIVESEALTLHAMMMTSNPYFLLMKPNTLEVINKVFEFRKSRGLHLCFTLDAGANVHLLYPENEKQQIEEFIEAELVAYCQNRHYIRDGIGSGAKKL
ncbi:MAG TPA: diphosphomevalonate decarboxylase [Salinimicrobium sp.]|nr:diphosphomevalonate decarboxylase [Salinimicrobium sp.]